MPVPTKSKPDRKPGKRLTIADRLQILDLHRKHPDWTIHKLAETCCCDWKTAQLIVLAAGQEASRLLEAFALPIFMDWRKASRKASDRGDHRPAKDWLMHAGIIDPLPDAGRGNGTTINILNAPLPGTATDSPVTLTIHPSDRQIPATDCQIPAAPPAPSTVLSADDDNLGGS